MEFTSIDGKDTEVTFNNEPVNQALSDSCSDNAGFSMKKITAEVLYHKIISGIVSSDDRKRLLLKIRNDFAVDIVNDRVYFCRMSFPDNYVVPGEKGKTWGRLKQIDQYNFLKRKIISLQQSDSVGRMLSYFEQFKTGNLHVHFIVTIRGSSWAANIKNFKCELANLFELPQRNKNLWAQFFDYTEINDCDSDPDNMKQLDNILQYLLYKTKKTYENLDLSTFQPITTTSTSSE